MDFFVQNFYYINFFSGWAYLLLAVACLISWRLKQGKFSYIWMMLFGLAMSAHKFVSVFYPGNFAFSGAFSLFHSLMLFCAAFFLFISAQITFNKLYKRKTLKYLIIPLSFLGLLGLLFGLRAFSVAMLVFMWIPAGILISCSVFKISKTALYEKRNIFYIFIFYVAYAVIYILCDMLKVFGSGSIYLHFMCQMLMCVIVFMAASLIFRYFKVSHEKNVRIYDYIPLYWRHVPIGAILFAVLFVGMFFSMYLENNSKSAIAKNSDAVVTSIAENVISRLSKADQLGYSLSISPYIQEILTYPERINKTPINTMLESYARSFNVSLIFILNNKGDMVLHSNLGGGVSSYEVNFKNRPYFAEAKRAGKSKVFTKGFFGAKEGYYASNIILNTHASPAGVLVVKDDLEDVSKKMRKYDNIYVVDKNGIVLLSDKDSGFFSSLWPFYDTSEGSKKDMLSKEVFDKDIIIFNDESYYVARQFINEEGWSVVYFNSLKPVRQFKILSMFVISGILVIVLLVFWTITQSTRIFALALQHKAILSSAKAIIIISVDTQGEIIVYGQGAEDIIGYNKNQISRKRFDEVFFNKNGIPITFEEAIDWHSNTDNEWLCRKSDGSYINILMSVVPQYSVGKKLIGYILSGVDITATKKVETELEQQLKFLQTLIDSMPIAVYYKNKDMHLIGCNKAFEDIMEKTKDEMIGKTSKIIYFDKDAAEYSTKTDIRVAREMSSTSYERIVKFKSGIKRNLVFYKSSYRKLDGKFGGIIGVMIDATKERRMQAERDALQSNLIQQNKLASLGELAGSIAHELNNPLSIITGFAQVLMKDKSLGEDARSAAKNIFEASNRSKSIITNMLEFARADSSKIQVFNVNDVIESTLLIVEKDFHKANIEIKKDLTAEKKSISANAMQLQQVLLNIILNAKDAMPAGGKMNIKTFTEDSKFVITIADTGVGIPGENFEKLFDPFYTTKDVGKGTGLGLSICYGIVNAYKGEISVKSKVGKGTTFSIKFPLV